MRGVLVAALFLAATVVAVTAQSAPVSKETFWDSDGNQVSNNEFVDIRMANFNYPDATIVKKLDDGRIEFRLQKVPQEGMQAPNFSVRTLDGKAVSLDSLKGKVIVLNFWFIGCPACLDLEPKLNVFKSKFVESESVVFIAMTADAESGVRKYLAKNPFDYTQVADAGDAMKSFAFSGYPKNIVIGKGGEIVYWRSTIKAWDKFESVIKRELER